MSALAARSNPILDGLKQEINKLIWQCFEDIKNDSIPIHVSVFHVPFNISIKLENLKDVITLLVGPEGKYDAVEVIPPIQPGVTQQ